MTPQSKTTAPSRHLHGRVALCAVLALITAALGALAWEWHSLRHAPHLPTHLHHHNRHPAWTGLLSPARPFHLCTL